MADQQLDAAQAAGAPPGMAVRLSSNEAPFGPAPAAAETIRTTAAAAHRYPDDQSERLRAAVAAHEDISVERVAAGAGSAALLMDIVAHECAGVAEPAVLAFERAFIVYRLAARNAGAAYVEAPVGGPARGGDDGYARDVDALLERVDERTRLVMIDNPGNPTGAHLDRAGLSRLLTELPDRVTVVIDEAYHQFAAGQRGYRPAREVAADHPRLVVVRTFSKAYALAGLRVGYLLGPADLVASVDGWRVRFNVNAAGQRAAVAALGDRDHLERTVSACRRGRERMAAGIRELGVPVSAGLGNFVTLELGGPAGPVVATYAERGVGVRPLGAYGMHEQLRVTAGTPEQVDAFLEASRAVLAGPGSGA